jgi:hypothetical protein
VPPGGGPPPHVHYREDETFVVLEGELALRVGDREFGAPVGTVLHVPRAMRHSFSAIGSTPARMLFHYAPPGMDGMFTEIGVPAKPDELPRPPGREDVAKFLSVAEKYGFEIYPPGT